MKHVIMYSFWGRRPNIELQLPFIRRILNENPQVTFHAWDLARTDEDRQYLRAIEGERITVRTEFCKRPWAFGNVWRHYTNRRYKNRLFVKVDDDVVFIETNKFPDFVAAIEDGTVLSAETINNGASTRLNPHLWEGFEALDIPLLDVHRHSSYAETVHTHMFEHWRDMIDQPVELVPTRDWTSINLIGYTWETGCRIADKVGRTAPRMIADRQWPRGCRLDDEAATNMESRAIMRGFTAAHLAFGPQRIEEDQLTLFRKRYAEIGRQYLEER